VGTQQNPQAADVPEGGKRVILAGFGHFGSTIGRLLRANGVEATILDYDADQVELLRKMGFKVFYGDATREDLLELAGAAEAEILISAIPNVETNLILAEMVHKHHPHLKFFARTRNRFDAYELMEQGVQHIYRETLDTSVRMGAEILQTLGFRAYSAHRSAQDFMRFDESAMSHLALKKRNMKEYIQSVRETVRLQEELLLADKERSLSDQDHSWDSEAIIENQLKR
jgi:CPA2 family monovalent cation:H+ antiporter-2